MLGTVSRMFETGLTLFRQHRWMFQLFCGSDVLLHSVLGDLSPANRWDAGYPCTVLCWVVAWACWLKQALNALAHPNLRPFFKIPSKLSSQINKNQVKSDSGSPSNIWRIYTDIKGTYKGVDPQWTFQPEPGSIYLLGVQLSAAASLGSITHFGMQEWVRAWLSSLTACSICWVLPGCSAQWQDHRD